jgi:aspartyl-tRNA(Asn)/glutamyl-tRNA(Gln) amidotransferase subunit C
MIVNDDLVQKIAHLARLNLAPTEIENTKADLQKMINFVDTLNNIDTTNIPPAIHMSSNVNILRADTPGNMLTAEQALQNAPQASTQFFKVPRVI